MWGLVVCLFVRLVICLSGRVFVCALNCLVVWLFACGVFAAWLRARSRCGPVVCMSLWGACACGVVCLCVC